MRDLTLTEMASQTRSANLGVVMVQHPSSQPCLGYMEEAILQWIVTAGGKN